MANPVMFQCPGCRQAYQVTVEQAAEYAGQTITCTACRQPFVVPPQIAQQPAPVAAPAPAAGPVYATPYPQFNQGVDYASPGQAMAMESNGMAIASLVCGILGLCLPVIPAGLAIVFGVVGLKKTNNPRVGGKGLAIAGLVLGGIGLIFTLLQLVVVMPALSAARERVKRVQCASNLRQIGQAILLYDNDNAAYPKDLGVLVAGGLSPQTLICPDSNDTPATGSSMQALGSSALAGGHNSYIYLGAALNRNSSPDAVLVYEPLSEHQEGSNFLFNDGHVDWLTRAQAQKAISELNMHMNPPPSVSGR